MQIQKRKEKKGIQKRVWHSIFCQKKKNDLRLIQKTKTFFLILFQKTGAISLIFAFLFSAFGPSFTYFTENGLEWSTTVIAEEKEKKVSDTGQKMGEAASFLVSIFSPLIAIEVGLVGILMSNDFIMGKGEAASGDIADAADIGEFLNHIWQVVRDIVNYAFIVILLIIAFMTVISAGGEMAGGDSGFNVKQILPKFVVAVVLVNFTWFGAKVILDVATVASNIVYSIPMTVGGDNVPAGDLSNCAAKDPKDREKCPLLKLKAIEAKGGSNLQKAKGAVQKGKLGPTVSGTELRYDTGIVNFSFTQLQGWGKLGPENITAIMAYNVLHVQELPISYGTETSLWQVTMKGIFALLLMLIILAIFSVMFFVLLERVMILWVNIMLSPVGVLLWVLKGTSLEISGGDNQVIGFGPFIKSAFLPAIMGIPMVFGLFLSIISKNGNIEITQLNDKVSITGIDTLVNGISDLHQLFFYIIVLGSMWMSMKMAEDGAHFTKGLVGGIRQGIEGVGSFIAKAPIYAPWIPTGTTGTDGKNETYAIGDLFRMGSKLRGFHENKSNNRTKDLFGLGSYLSKLQKDTRTAVNRIIKDHDSGDSFGHNGDAKTLANHIQHLNTLQGETQRKEYMRSNMGMDTGNDKTLDVVRSLGEESNNTEVKNEVIKLEGGWKKTPGTAKTEEEKDET